MKKILIFLFFAISTGLFSQIKVDTSTIVLIDTTIVEEFRSLDENGNQLTNYRRISKKDINNYIKRIQETNDAKRESINMTDDEIRMYTSMMKEAKDRKEKLQAEIKENARRIEVYKQLRSVLFPPK